MKKIQICGIVGWDCTPSGLRQELEEAAGDSVELEISSPGGYIAPGLEMFNLIRNYQGEINVRLTGYAMSMASYLPLAVKARQNPGKIVAEDNAVFMIHNARGGTFGDHNDILGYGEYLKGLSNVIARQYVKRTGKSMEEIVGMMDAETFFFGEEMVDNGFVDEIIEIEREDDENDDDERDSLMATAKAAFLDCAARMNEKPEAIKKDYMQASRMLSDNEFNPPAPSAGKTKKEDQQMVSLKELLTDNPKAKAEYDDALAAARSEGEKSVRATIDRVVPLMTSGEYPKVITETAIKVLKGEEAMGTLTASVAAVDAVKQQAEQNAAAAEQNGSETPGQQQRTLEAGQAISSDEELQLLIKQDGEG